ncbi:hypothetical protein CYMTET_12570 [Cymbomonas tetramitiformis]|uniref:Uncharacterized protein n=1 Tax=Cymbomonas tetramitiformis TaxID=36881 RepID=A0AAE0LBX7_9CHLO|nr:hypothetical protein CYMTET_12570 [Cymbomonas tetramitiformis]
MNTTPACARRVGEFVSAMVDLRSAQPDFVTAESTSVQDGDGTKRIDVWRVIPNVEDLEDGESESRILWNRGAMGGNRTPNSAAFAYKNVFRDIQTRTRAYWKAQRANLCIESAVFLYRVFVEILRVRGATIDSQPVSNVGIAHVKLALKPDSGFENPYLLREGNTIDASPTLIATNFPADVSDAQEVDHFVLTLRTVEGAAYHMDITAAQFDEPNATSRMGYPLLVGASATPTYHHFDSISCQQMQAAVFCEDVNQFCSLFPYSHRVEISCELTLCLLSNLGDTNDWTAVWETYYRSGRAHKN